jgi:hypothetical protein
MKQFSVICLALSVHRCIDAETARTEIHPVAYQQKCKIAPAGQCTHLRFGTSALAPIAISPAAPRLAARQLRSRRLAGCALAFLLSMPEASPPD